jgi:F0F1-type ATP synthase delta subunit
MKYRPQIYAKAFAAAVAARHGKDEAALVKRFVALVRRNGDEAGLRKIIKETERMISKSAGVRRIIVESARPLDPSAHSLLKNILKRSDVVEERVNLELIAGVKITVDEETEFDGSLKGKLDTMFA